MIKKINILIIIFLFFASTTGLPLVMHYCEMMEAASLDECEMHNPEIIITSCCENNNLNSVKISKVTETCCESFLIDKSVKENFISSKNEITKEEIFIINIDIFSPEVLTLHQNFSETDTSPPSLADNHLYLTNSILLI